MDNVPLPRLIPSHLLRPREFPRNHISRGHIVELFQRHTPAKVLFVEARAGYGKSLAVAEFVRHLACPIAWYPLELLPKNDPLLFLWNLVRSIQVELPNFGNETEALLAEFAGDRGRGSKWLETTVLPALVSELIQMARPLAIILENYHSLKSEELEGAMTYLIEYAPSGIRFVVTSRETILLPARPRLESMDMVATIAATDLAFTPTESQELAHHIGVTLSETQTVGVHDHTKGWPILHYFLYHYLRGQSLEQVLETLKILASPTEVIYRYLFEELLRKESPSHRDFLCRTSILQQLDTPSCNALLGIENAGDLLNQLKNELFLSRVSHSFIHSHELVREFLHHVLLREYGREEIAQLYERLGEHLEARGEWDQAISSYSQGAHFARATRLIEHHAQILINTAQLGRLEGWLASLPRGWVEEAPTLLVFWGLVLAEQRNPAAVEYLHQAVGMFSEEGDPLRLAWAKGELGWAYCIAAKSRLAIQYVQEALAEPTITPRLRAKFLHYNVMAFQMSDDFGQAIQNGDQAIQLLRQLGSREDMMALTRLLRHLSMVYKSAGRLPDSARVIEEAYELAQTLDLGDWALAWILNERAEVRRQAGRFEEAHACLDKADLLLGKYRDLGSSSLLIDFVSNLRGNLYRDEYLYEQAAARFQKSRLGQEGLFLSLYVVQPEYAQEALGLALQEYQQVQSNESPVVRAKYQALLGLAYMGIQDREQALHHLEAATEILQEYKAFYYVATMRLYLAKLYADAGDYRRSNECLRYALTMLANGSYYNLDVWHPSYVAEMCARALEEQIEVAFVKRLAKKRLTDAYATPFVRLVSHTDAAVRESATTILQSLGSATRLEARKRLYECADLRTREKLVGWLDKGWLTELGLLRLTGFLTWRQIEVFLLWICPRTEGSASLMYEELCLTKYTVAEHLTNIRLAFEEQLGVSFSRGRGIQGSASAYEWAIHNGVVDPLASSSC